MAWTYILECSDNSYYVGSTVDLDHRVAQHNAGEGAKYTRRRTPVKLVWCTQVPSIREAYLFEKQVQGWGRAKREALINGNFDLLPDLASRSWSARHPLATEQEPDRLPDEPPDREPGPTRVVP